MASDSKSRRGRAASQAPAAKKPSPHRPRRGPLAHALNMDSEQSARLLLIGGVALVVLIALGFIGFGYWNSVVKPRNRTILEAGGVKVSYSAMKRRMAYEFAQNPLYDQAYQALPAATYSTLVNEIAVVTHAEGDQGVAASDDEVGTQVGFKINAPPGTDQKAFAEALRTALATSGLHEDEYRRLVKAEYLSNQITDKMTKALPATVQQAKVEVIQTETQDAANKAADRIRAGEDWATVAKEISLESDVQTTGGLHDYGFNGSFDATYNDTAFSAAVGEVSKPIASSGNSSFFIIRVAERSDQPVRDEQKSPLVTKQYSDWLTDVQGRMVIVNHWDEHAQNDALRAVVQGAKPRTPTIPGINTNGSSSGFDASTGSDAQPQQAPPADPAGDGSSDANPPVPNAPVAPDSGNGQ